MPCGFMRFAFIIPDLSAEAGAPVRLRNSDKCLFISFEQFLQKVHSYEQM